MISIFQVTHDAYVRQVLESLSRGGHHASLVYSEFFRQGSLEGLWARIEPQAVDLVKLIVAMTDFTVPVITQVESAGAVQKMLITFADGHAVESVVIPMKSGNTLCVSSQVGCKMGCTFCQTGKMGLIRHLTRGEIVAQLFCAQFYLKVPIKNIVFMGMGEPLDNYEEVMGAVQILTDPKGCGLGPSRITISTSGRVDQIYRMIHDVDPALNLAVSVNAPNDAIRRKIMPVNRKWNMESLKHAMSAYCLHPRRTILVEYVLLKGINDDLSHADELACYLDGLRVTVNLIPYNPGRQACLGYAAPALEDCRAFLAQVKSHGLMATLREEKGQNLMAACGQLLVMR